MNFENAVLAQIRSRLNDESTEAEEEAVTANWDRPSFDDQTGEPLRKRIKLNQGERELGPRGRLEIKLRSGEERMTASDRELRIGLRQSYREMWEASVR